MDVDSILKYEKNINEVTMDVDSGLFAVPEVVSHIAASTDKLPKECVILCMEGLCERVADMNSRTQAMKSLTTFAHAVTPGFISERMSKIMNEPKNPEVLRGALLWMVSVVEDYGVSHLKHKDVIDFCLNTGLDSSDDTTRNATRKLLGAFHKFVDPEFESLALYCAVEAKLENNSFEESKQLEKMSLDDPQDANLDDMATKLDLLQTSLDSFYNCNKEEICRQDMEAMRRWKEIEASAQCTRCDIPLRYCMCETIFDTPFGSFLQSKDEQPKLLLHMDTGYGKRRITDTLWTPHEEFKSSGPYACTYPSIVLKE